MSLINCPECGKEISDKSEKCINCGYNLKKHIREIEKQQRKEQRKTIKVSKKVILIVVLILTLVGLGIGGIQIYRWYASKLVPNVVEMTAKQAQDLLTERGFDSEVTHEYTTSFEKGIVYEQSVAANSFYDSEDAIILMVSKGKTYTVPDIVGKNINDVEISELPHAIEYIYTDDKVEGYIVSVNKEVGTQYHDGDKVTIIVSKGMYTVLPDLKQMTKDQAIATLEEYGCKVKVVEELSFEIAEGNVMRYNPQKFGEKGSTISLTVSKGAGVTVVNVTRCSLEEAEKIFKDAGLKYTIMHDYPDLSVDCKSDENIVATQNRMGIVSKEEADNIVLTISKPSIKITDVDWDINSVGGVDTYIYFKNISDKQIAYVTFDMKYYDRMGNPAECTIKDRCVASLQYTGPLDAGKTQGNRNYWEAVIYNNTVAVLQPLSAKIEFTDGSIQNLEYTGRYWYNKNYYGGSLND